jgi:hypothetical protein
MDKDKPYSLPWWLDIMDTVNDRCRRAQSGPERNEEQMFRMAVLHGWITRRIVRKYGIVDRGVFGPLWIAGKNAPQYFNVNQSSAAAK